MDVSYILKDFKINNFLILYKKIILARIKKTLIKDANQYNQQKILINVINNIMTFLLFG